MRDGAPLKSGDRISVVRARALDLRVRSPHQGDVMSVPRAYRERSDLSAKVARVEAMSLRGGGEMPAKRACSGSAFTADRPTEHLLSPRTRSASFDVVRSQQIAHLLTAEEAFWLNPSERWELVEGRIVEMSPVKKRHGRILARLAHRFEEHVERNRLGEVYVGDVGFILRRNPDTVRAPDLAFIRKERLPALEEEEGFSAVVPDLAVEIPSPSDRWTEVEAKIAEYFAAGVKAIWIVDPSRDEVRSFHPGKAVRTLAKADTLEEPELVPGLKLSLADLLG